MDTQCSTLSRIDTPLNDRIHHALTESSHIAPYLQRQRLHYIEIDGCVVLKGTVETFHEKQVAQEAIRKIDGVVQIDNQLEVTWRKAG